MDSHRSFTKERFEESLNWFDDYYTDLIQNEIHQQPPKKSFSSALPRFPKSISIVLDFSIACTVIDAKNGSMGLNLLLDAFRNIVQRLCDLDDAQQSKISVLSVFHAYESYQLSWRALKDSPATLYRKLHSEMALKHPHQDPSASENLESEMKNDFINWITTAKKKVNEPGYYSHRCLGKDSDYRFHSQNKALRSKGDEHEMWKDIVSTVGMGIESQAVGHVWYITLHGGSPLEIRDESMLYLTKCLFRKNIIFNFIIHREGILSYLHEISFINDFARITGGIVIPLESVSQNFQALYDPNIKVIDNNSESGLDIDEFRYLNANVNNLVRSYTLETDNFLNFLEIRSRQGFQPGSLRINNKLDQSILLDMAKRNSQKLLKSNATFNVTANPMDNNDIEPIGMDDELKQVPSIMLSWVHRWKNQISIEYRVIFRADEKNTTRQQPRSSQTTHVNANENPDHPDATIGEKESVVASDSESSTKLSSIVNLIQNTRNFRIQIYAIGTRKIMKNLNLLIEHQDTKLLFLSPQMLHLQDLQSYIDQICYNDYAMSNLSTTLDIQTLASRIYKVSRWDEFFSVNCTYFLKLDLQQTVLKELVEKLLHQRFTLVPENFFYVKHIPQESYAVFVDASFPATNIVCFTTAIYSYKHLFQDIVNPLGDFWDCLKTNGFSLISLRNANPDLLFIPCDKLPVVSVPNISQPALSMYAHKQVFRCFEIEFTFHSEALIAAIVLSRFDAKFICYDLNEQRFLLDYKDRGCFVYVLNKTGAQLYAYPGSDDALFNSLKTFVYEEDMFLCQYFATVNLLTAENKSSQRVEIANLAKHSFWHRWICEGNWPTQSVEISIPIVADAETYQLRKHLWEIFQNMLSKDCDVEIVTRTRSDEKTFLKGLSGWNAIVIYVVKPYDAFAESFFVDVIYCGSPLLWRSSHRVEDPVLDLEKNQVGAIGKEQYESQLQTIIEKIQKKFMQHWICGLYDGLCHKWNIDHKFFLLCLEQCASSEINICPETVSSSGKNGYFSFIANLILDSGKFLEYQANENEVWYYFYDETLQSCDSSLRVENSLILKLEQPLCLKYYFSIGRSLPEEQDNVLKNMALVAIQELKSKEISRNQNCTLLSSFRYQSSQWHKSVEIFLRRIESFGFIRKNEDKIVHFYYLTSEEGQKVQVRNVDEDSLTLVLTVKLLESNIHLSLESLEFNLEKISSRGRYVLIKSGAMLYDAEVAVGYMEAEPMEQLEKILKHHPSQPPLCSQSVLHGYTFTTMLEDLFDNEILIRSLEDEAKQLGLTCSVFRSGPVDSYQTSIVVCSRCSNKKDSASKFFVAQVTPEGSERSNYVSIRLLVGYKKSTSEQTDEMEENIMAFKPFEDIEPKRKLKKKLERKSRRALMTLVHNATLRIIREDLWYKTFVNSSEQDLFEDGDEERLSQLVYKIDINGENGVDPNLRFPREIEYKLSLDQYCHFMNSKWQLINPDSDLTLFYGRDVSEIFIIGYAKEKLVVRLEWKKHESLHLFLWTNQKYVSEELSSEAISAVVESIGLWIWDTTLT